MWQRTRHANHVVELEEPSFDGIFDFTSINLLDMLGSQVHPTAKERKASLRGL
jgi:hypothetical protein